MLTTVELVRPNRGWRPRNWRPRNRKVHKCGQRGPSCSSDGTVTMTDDDEAVTCHLCLYHLGRYIPLEMRPQMLTEPTSAMLR